MDKIKDFFDDIPREVKQGVSIALVIIFLFCSGLFLGGVLRQEEVQQVEGTTGSTAAPITTVAPTTTAAPTTTVAPATTTAAPATEITSTAAPAGDTTTAAVQTDATTTTAAASTGAPTTKADIIALFNESANKIKTNATSVTRNFEDRRHEVDKLQVPSALESTAESLISKFLVKNETPETYTGNADIVANFPIPGETWVSKLTEADVAEATCTDNGTEYEIVIKTITQRDAALGTGVGACFEVIKSEDVMNNAGFIIKSFSTEYYDCVVKCKIDKATGNITWINYTTPVVIELATKINIDAQLGVTFEKDYVITY